MKYLEIAKVINTHGLEGEVKVSLNYYGRSFNHWIPKQTIYLQDEDYYLPLRIRSVRSHKNFLLLTFENFTEIDSVLFMKKKSLTTINDDETRDSNFSFENLIDYQVINNEDQKILGTIIALIDNNNSGLWEIVNDKRKTFYLPNNQFFITEVDKEKKVIYINIISGMFDYE